MKKELPLTRELELAANRARQKRLGFEQPLFSQRQKRRLKLKAKKLWVEITALWWIVIAVLVGSDWWVPMLAISWGMIIILWRARNRDIAKGNAEVERRLAHDRKQGKAS